MKPTRFSILPSLPWHGSIGRTGGGRWCFWEDTLCSVGMHDNCQLISGRLPPRLWCPLPDDACATSSLKFKIWIFAFDASRPLSSRQQVYNGVPVFYVPEYFEEHGLGRRPDGTELLRAIAMTVSDAATTELCNWLDAHGGECEHRCGMIPAPFCRAGGGRWRADRESVNRGTHKRLRTEQRHVTACNVSLMLS